MDGVRPVLDQFNLVVRDMDASLAFYRRLGLVFEDGDPQWDRHHRSAKMPGGVDLDLDSIEFARTWDRGWPGGSGGQTGALGFRLPSREAVDRLHEDLTAAGYRSQQPPYDAFWGARFAVIEDPDGNAVALMSPSEAAFRRPPPPPPDA